MLTRARENRVATLRVSKPEGSLFRGFEELLNHLDALVEAFKQVPQLGRIAFLLIRGKADFAVAMDAALGGISTVVFDKMRDAMEIHFLLRDFLFQPEHIEEWFSIDEKSRWKQFSPARLRERYAKDVGKKTSDLWDEPDYKGHSKQLHVSPGAPFFGAHGIATKEDFPRLGVCFSEMFDHAYNLLETADKLGRSLAKDKWKLADPTRSLSKFLDGRSSTALYKSMFLTLLQALI